eukprot:526580-Pyramimonas_sp.AAC.1
MFTRERCGSTRAGLGLLGGLMEAAQGPLDSVLGAFLDSSGGLQGASRGHFGTSWERLGPLQASWGPLG